MPYRMAVWHYRIRRPRVRVTAPDQYHRMAQSSARACLMPCRSQRASAVWLSRVSSQLLERERCAYARGRMSKGALGIMLECDLVGLGQSGVSHLDRGEWGCSRGEF